MTPSDAWRRLAARADPAGLIGKRIRKNFGPEFGFHWGTIDGYNPARQLYHATYDDNDDEDQSSEHFLHWLVED